MKEGEGRNTWREQERTMKEEGDCREREMEIGKEECRARVTFGVRKSSQSNNRGRPTRRGKGRR